MGLGWGYVWIGFLRRVEGNVGDEDVDGDIRYQENQGSGETEEEERGLRVSARDERDKIQEKYWQKDKNKRGERAQEV